MFDISNNGIITISRGDSFSLSVFINIGTQIDPISYTLEEGDKVYFALMEPHQPFECALIRKEYTKEDQDEEAYVNMDFNTDMTEFIMPGNYYYMVKLFRANGSLVDTIISKTKFIIID